MNETRHPLRINVGFIIHAATGFIRDFEFEFPQLHLPPDLDLRQVKISARIGRTPQGLLARGDASGYTTLECVRCLENYDQYIHANFTELYAFDERSTDEAELLVPEDGFIDLGPLVREYLFLEFPIKPLCKTNCKPLQEAEDPDASPKVEDDIDPRLAVLKKLLDQE